MERVKQMVEAGVRVGTAIREALAELDTPLTMSSIAAKYSLPRSSTNEAYNGLRQATPAQVDALVAELGGTPEEWRDLLKQARLAAVHAA
jgi:plasmid maintenance system antidote protein VapI